MVTLGLTCKVFNKVWINTLWKIWQKNYFCGAVL